MKNRIIIDFDIINDNSPLHINKLIKQNNGNELYFRLMDDNGAIELDSYHKAILTFDGNDTIMDFNGNYITVEVPDLMDDTIGLVEFDIRISDIFTKETILRSYTINNVSSEISDKAMVELNKNNYVYELVEVNKGAKTHAELTEVQGGQQHLDIPVDTTEITDGQVLIYNDALGAMIPGDAGGDSLDGITGAEIASLGTSNFTEYGASLPYENIVSIGHASLYDTSGITNALKKVVSIGDNAGTYLADSLMENVNLIGYQAGSSGGGSFNNYVGCQSGIKSKGDYNVGIGDQALYHITLTTFEKNTALGSKALKYNTTGASSNTAVGYNSLYQTSYSNSTGLGANTSVNGSNQVQLGDSATTTYAYGAVTDRSDARDKTDIVNEDLGLNFLMNIQPRKFKMNYREDYIEEILKADYDENDETIAEVIRETETSFIIRRVNDGSKTRIREHHGVIAQEVKEVLDTMGIDWAGYKDAKIDGGEDVLSIGYQEFIAPLIQAVKELKTKQDSLEARLIALENS